MEFRKDNISKYCKNCYELAEQLNKLKTELEQEKTLKETYLTCYKAKHDDIDGELFKLKQTLIEIKEIAGKAYNDCDACYGDVDTNCDVDCIDCTLGSKAELAEQILQKISECEINYEN